jgi:integrase
MLAQRDSGQLVTPNKVLLRDYLERWLTDWCTANLSPTSRERYELLVRGQILPFLGNVKLQDLKPAHLSRWYAQLLENGNRRGGPLNPVTIKFASRVLHRALAIAVQDEIITRNPCSIRSAPKVERKEVQILSPEEVTRLLRTFRGRNLQTFVTTALATGARRGELLALRWSDVDLERGTVSIERSLEQTTAGLRFKSPKTKSGRRTIGIPASVCDELRLHYRRQLERRLKLGQGRLPDSLVFSTWDGQPRHPRAVTIEFMGVVRASGLPGITLHSLRHCHASALIAAGLDPVTVSKRLGHATPQTTLLVYSHVFQQRDAEAVAAIDGVLAQGLGES